MNNIEKLMGIKLRRSRADRRRMYLIGFGVLIVIIIFSLYFTSKTATAGTNRVKMVASVEVKKGDTLWSIAADYMTDEYSDINDYIEEIKDSNRLTSDTIHAGNFIIVPYYASAY